MSLQKLMGGPSVFLISHTIYLDFREVLAGGKGGAGRWKEEGYHDCLSLFAIADVGLIFLFLRGATQRSVCVF